MEIKVNNFKTIEKPKKNKLFVWKIRRASGPGRVRPSLAWNGKSEQGVNVPGRICERISQDCTDMEDTDHSRE